MGAACCKECCGAIYEDELEAHTDELFTKFRDEHGNIPADKVPEAARAVFKLYGGGLLPYIKASQLEKQHSRVPGAPGASLDRYHFGLYIHLLAQGAKKAYLSRSQQPSVWFDSGGLAYVGGDNGGGCADNSSGGMNGGGSCADNSSCCDAGGGGGGDGGGGC